MPAEFKPNLFHKRGALNAAREGDDSNKNRSSSSTQFTIVQGKVYNDSTLDHAQYRINKWLAYNNVINKSKTKETFEQFQNLLKKLELLTEEDVNEDDLSLYKTLKSELDSLAKIEVESMQKYTYPETHREIYKTTGGAAHLDQNYTVFGEVVKGMDVVDSIAAVKTNDKDKPIVDVRVITARMIKRQKNNEY